MAEQAARWSEATRAAEVERIMAAGDAPAVMEGVPPAAAIAATLRWCAMSGTFGCTYLRLALLSLQAIPLVLIFKTNIAIALQQDAASICICTVYTSASASGILATVRSCLELAFSLWLGVGNITKAQEA